jgi:hypothetical protein
VSDKETDADLEDRRPSCCAGERALRREALAMLRSSQEANQRLESRSFDLEARLERTLHENRRLGRALERAQILAKSATDRAERLARELTDAAAGVPPPPSPPRHSSIGRALLNILRPRAEPSA